MKQLYFLLALLAFLVVQPATAQPLQYGNEWIDYGKTYYKFRTGAEGVYRITKPMLDNAGFTGVNGATLKLVRDGAEVPVYVSTGGAFGATDYLEFYAPRMNGNLDRELYANPSWHPNDRISLFTDSATYFLTTDGGGTRLRYSQIGNNIPANPTPTPFVYAEAARHFTRNFLDGQHVVNLQPIFSSEFQNGEGLVDSFLTTTGLVSYSLQTPHAVSGHPARFSSTVLRHNYLTFPDGVSLQILINNQLLADSQITWDETQHIDVPFSSSLLSANNTIAYQQSTTPTSTLDGYGVSFFEIQYPRDLDVTGLTYLRFALQPSSSKQYLEFLNFTSANAPRLYDVTNRQWYEANVSQPGKTRFYIEPSFTDRTLVLVSTNGLSTPSALKTAQFRNWGATGNEASYVVITHKAYEANTNGRNYVADYAAYRASTTGGGYSVTIADVEDLYDQFAYGASMHPLAIRRFLQYAYYKWNSKPKDVFLVGKGIYYPVYRRYLQNAGAYGFSGVVPTWGSPGADLNFVNFLPGKLQAMNIGRLSAWNPTEVSAYLEKVKTYESALNNVGTPNVTNDLWKKRVLHVAGGKDLNEQNGFISTLSQGASIIGDTSYGAVISQVKKNTTVPVDMAGSQQVDSIINGGISFLTYIGHASSNSVEFVNLNTPEVYNATPRFPHFLALGCDVAQIFTLSPVKTIGEKYINAPSGGSVSLIASDNLQYAWYYAQYLPAFYTSVSRKNYGQPVGVHHHATYDSITKFNSSPDWYFQSESLMLLGDPALRVPGEAKPDYHVANSGISSLPANVTTAQDSFKLRVTAYNLGKALRDTVRVKVEHINPAGSTTTVKLLEVVNLFNVNTLFVTIPVNKTVDLGLNKYRVTIDDDGKFDEESEANNVAQLELFIYSDNLIPVYPKEFAIVGQQGITLKASTLNPFRTTANYRMEIDTTELFNSPQKQSVVISSKGGVIKWQPGISFQNNRVYYWRTAFDSLQNGSYQWANSSFVFLAGSGPGWNQSHYYQYLKDGFDSLNYEGSRVFSFQASSNKLRVTNAVLYEDDTLYTDAMYASVYFNGAQIQRAGCPPWGGTLQVMVMDTVTNKPWQNAINGTAGAYAQCLTTRNVYVFEFPMYTKQGRDNAAAFIRDSIPNGYFVLLRNLINDDAYTPTYVDTWKADTLVNGPGQSLYHVVKNLGFNTIDSFNQQRVFIFLRQKGSNAFPVYQYFAQTDKDSLDREFTLPAKRSSGKMISTVIGPASQWNNLKWQTSAGGNAAGDAPLVVVTGIDTNGVNNVLYQGNARDTALSFINAALYPNIQLTWRSIDSVRYTSPQLNFWRVLYTPVPEAGLNPSLHFVYRDSAQAGQEIQFSTAIENLTPQPMDSLLVRYRLIDAAGVTHTLASRRYKKLTTEGDTLHASISFNPQAYNGLNTFFVEANPDEDQPEQYHPNNLGYLPLYVEGDLRNPLIDVTFDGVHILNRDIVSAKPFIRILLKDENKYLALDDTSLLKVSIRYPDDPLSTRRAIPFDGTVCRFIPANCSIAMPAR